MTEAKKTKLIKELQSEIEGSEPVFGSIAKKFTELGVNKAEVHTRYGSFVYGSSSLLDSNGKLDQKKVKEKHKEAEKDGFEPVLVDVKIKSRDYRDVGKDSVVKKGDVSVGDLVMVKVSDDVNPKELRDILMQRPATVEGVCDNGCCLTVSITNNEGEKFGKRIDLEDVVVHYKSQEVRSDA